MKNSEISCGRVTFDRKACLLQKDLAFQRPALIGFRNCQESGDELSVRIHVRAPSLRKHCHSICYGQVSGSSKLNLHSSFATNWNDVRHWRLLGNNHIPIKSMFISLQ